MIDDLSHADVKIVVLRELLRAIGLQGAYVLASKGKPRVNSEGTLAILRLFLTLISRPDPDTVFLASQRLSILEEDFNPQQKRGVFTNNIMGYQSISRILQYAAGSITADAYSPTTDADEYIRLAIDDLANLIPVSRLRLHLRYATENLIIEVPPVDRFWDTPLWADELSVPNKPEYWSLNNQPKDLAIINYFREQPAIWQFWEDWYSGYLTGNPMDSRQLEAVAKIPDNVWDKGADAVAVEIKRIEARFRTAIATPLIRGSEDSSFRLDFEAALPAETLDFIKERVGGALASALEAGGNNGFDETCYEAIAIEKALASKNPSAVAGLLADASFSFQSSIGTQYPQDGGLIALRASAFVGSEEICDEDEAARKRCYRLAKLYVDQNATPIDQTELKEFTDAISEEADDEVEAILRNDANEISKGNKRGRFSRARFANYATTIVQWIDKSRKGQGRAEWLWKMVGRLLDALKDAPPD
ncbi:hypothetical protein [uncultured Sulfitobacter sp.]|uniref:hypothetical protein n=1 Tax=uncultured Sulfitobacter sp. TaxID=191468 RepID=UPI00262FCE47|nr:hypothetical protein [uncultured Sulfitobacter sp.]